MSRVFPQFPEHGKCPICLNNTDTYCILVPIEGTEEGNNMQAKPVHINCIMDNLVIDKEGNFKL